MWTEAGSEQREDSYRVVLQFRRPARGLVQEQTGEEEFIFDLMGKVQDLPVLAWPEGPPANAATPPPRVEAPPDPHFPRRGQEFGEGMMFPPFIIIRGCAGILATVLLALKRFAGSLFAKGGQNKD